MKTLNMQFDGSGPPVFCLVLHLARSAWFGDSLGDNRLRSKSRYW